MRIMDEDKEPRKSFNQYWKNLLHIGLIFALFSYTFYTVIVDGYITTQNFWERLLDCIIQASVNDIFTFIGALAFILFGIVGIYEYAYTNGFHGLLPPFYLKFRAKNDEKNAANMMKTYYKQDLEFIQQYEQERANRILQTLGIAEKQFHHIQYELVRARVMPQGTPKEMAAKLKSMVYQRDFIIDQSKTPSEKRIYRQVNYFINLYTALYDSDLCARVGDIMADYIIWCYSQDSLDYADIDYVLVPYNGNLLLGLEVGRLLQKPVIAVQEKPRILKDKCWDGNYKPKVGGINHVIIIHDVLVTGDRIYQSAEKLPRDTYVIDGLFCLIQYDNRKDNPKKALKSHGIHNVKCLLHTDEKTLKKVKMNKL